MYLQVNSVVRMAMLVRRTKPIGYEASRPESGAIAEIRFSVNALRTVRAGLINLTYALEDYPQGEAYLVLVNPAITSARLHDEWRRAAAVLKPEVLARLALCLVDSKGAIRGVPADPPADVQAWLREAVEQEAAHASAPTKRMDYEFVILKLLIHQWLMSGDAVTTTWLSHTAGCSYPTVARILKGLGSLIERTSDRRVGLRFFPPKEFSKLLAMSERARSTTRFVDRSGQPRRPDTHLRNLERMKPPGVAVGGVLGARHYVPELDLAGTPRLDLSIHRHGAPLNFDVIKALDPALEREDDPLKPANVVVHAIRHADPLFASGQGDLAWADPVECLLDLHEARLESQADQFLEALQRSRESRHAD